MCYVLMTVNIAVCLDDGILLVADGRRIQVSSGATKDDVYKISSIGTDFVITQAGHAIIAGMIIQSIRPDVISQAKSIEEIKEEVEYAKNSILPRLLELKKKTNFQTRTKVELLFGGLLDQKEPFVGWYRFYEGLQDNFHLYTKPGTVISGGYMNLEKRVMFKRRVKEKAGTLGSANYQDFLDEAQISIREIEKEEPQVGGIIRYAKLRIGNPLILDTIG